MELSYKRTHRLTFSEVELHKMVELAKAEVPISKESIGIIARVNPFLTKVYDGTTGTAAYERKGRKTITVNDLGFTKEDVPTGNNPNEAKIDWESIRYKAYQKKLLGYELSPKEIEYARQYMKDHNIDPATIADIVDANATEEDEAERYSRVFAANATKTAEEIIAEDFK